MNFLGLFTILLKIRLTVFGIGIFYFLNSFVKLAYFNTFVFPALFFLLFIFETIFFEFFLPGAFVRA